MEARGSRGGVYIFYPPTYFVITFRPKACMAPESANVNAVSAIEAVVSLNPRNRITLASKRVQDWRRRVPTRRDEE